MNKRIGILGGISYESTKVYYETVHKKYYEIKQDYYYPEIVIFSLNFQKFTDYENNNKRKYIEYILEGMAGLERAGVDFIIMAANSPHSVFQDIVKRTDLPIHSISDATMNKAKELKLKKLLLFGIKHTMDSNFYPESGAEYDIEIIVPTDREKTIIDGIIFSELCIGKIIDRSKSKLLDIINSYDVDGVILGCTELPLIINETDLNIAVLNTLEIHVENTLLKCMR